MGRGEKSVLNRVNDPEIYVEKRTKVTIQKLFTNEITEFRKKLICHLHIHHVTNTKILIK